VKSSTICVTGQLKAKYQNTYLTGLPLLNSFLVLKGTDTSVVPMLLSGGVGAVGGSEKQHIGTGIGILV